MLSAALSSPSASCSSCEMTPMEFCVSHGVTEDCGAAEATREGAADETWLLCTGDESAVGNSTSETTCQQPVRTHYSFMQLLKWTSQLNITNGSVTDKTNGISRRKHWCTCLVIMGCLHDCESAAILNFFNLAPDKYQNNTKNKNKYRN